jgi:Macrocin-O-methyltransferase (TylF)
VNPRAAAKVVLSRAGRRCSGQTIYNLNGAFNYLHLGWWLHAHGFEPAVTLPSRVEIFEHVAAEIGARRVLYLEFGVRQGKSIRIWSRLLRNPEAMLHGFDSFEGLPHDWTLEGHGRGDFSTGGEPPHIDDERVRFFVGWFDDTLPAYQWLDHDVLFAMLDADLYSSTVTVLDHVKEHLAPGAYLYFDQLHHRCDELRAFAEFIDENPEFTFTLDAVSRDYSSAAFRRVG